MDPVVLSYHDSLVRESDVTLIDAPNWLNDIIIGFAFEYFENETLKDKNANICFISPEVTQFIKLSPVEEVGMFLEPLNLSEKDLIFLAVNDNASDVTGGSHWSLMVYRASSATFMHFDSCGQSNGNIAKNVASKMKNFTGDNAFNYTECKSPKQSNSYDCGMYVICNTEKICENFLSGKSLDHLDEVTSDYVRNYRAKLKDIIGSLVK